MAFMRAPDKNNKQKEPMTYGEDDFIQQICVVLVSNLMAGFDLDKDESSVLANELERFGVDKSIMSDPKSNASQLLGCKDHWNNELSDSHGRMGDYTTSMTTSGMGSVNSSRNGSRGRDGRLIRRD